MTVSGFRSQVEGSDAKQPSTFNFQLFVAVLLLAVALRALLWFGYQPVTYSDTPSYRRLALGVMNGFDGYDGTRTPGYPIFLTLFRPDQDGWERRAWLAQLALGVAITGLMYFLGWRVSGKNRVGVVMALAYTLNLGQVFFESNLLTETLTTFWLTLTLAGLALWLYRPPRRSWLAFILAFGIGLAAGITSIVRPLFIFLPVWVVVFLLLKVEGGKVKVRPSTFNLQQAVFVLLPAILILGSWMLYLHNTYGGWGLTTMTGYHLIQHTGSYFEYVPDEYAALRDTYLQYRDAQIAEHGTQTNAIWEAIPAIQEASGLNFFDLSDTLAEISVQLIRQHPDLFLKNAIQGWWMFWRAPVYWSADALRWPTLAAPLRILILAERVVLVVCNLAFIGFSAGMMVLWAVRCLRKVEGCKVKVGPRIINLQLSTFTLFLASTIWICSIIQTLLDHGDNPRFLIPLQTAVILWLMATIRIINAKSQTSAITSDH